MWRITEHVNTVSQSERSPSCVRLLVDGRRAFCHFPSCFHWQHECIKTHFSVSKQSFGPVVSPLWAVCEHKLQSVHEHKVIKRSPEFGEKMGMWLHNGSVRPQSPLRWRQRLLTCPCCSWIHLLGWMRALLWWNMEAPWMRSTCTTGCTCETASCSLVIIPPCRGISGFTTPTRCYSSFKGSLCKRCISGS